MAKEDQFIAEVKQLVSSLENIRNIGIAAHIDHGKCVAGDAVISLASGDNVPAKELFKMFERKGKAVRDRGNKKVVRVSGLFVNSLDKSRNKIKRGRVSHAWKLRKTEPLIEIGIESGRAIKTTPEHKFLVLDKETGRIIERRADAVKKSDVVVSARKLLHEGMDEKKLKKDILKRLGKDGGFYGLLSKRLKERLHREILDVGVKKVHPRLNTGLKEKSFYHMVWRGRYRLNLLVKICVMLKTDLSEVYDNLKWINYRGMERRGSHSSLAMRLPHDFEEFYYLAGLFFGDGDCEGNITNNHPFIHHKLKRIGRSLGLKCNIRTFANRATRIEIGGMTLKKVLGNLFDYPEKKKSWNIRTPLFLNVSQKSFVAAFIRGYMDADGTVEQARSAVSVSSVSGEFLDGLQLLLYKFDVGSILNRRKGALYISGKSSLEMFRKVGFSLPEKKERFAKLLKKSSVSKLDHVPISGRLLKELREGAGVPANQISSYYRNYEENLVGLSKESLKNILDRFSCLGIDDSGLRALVCNDVAFLKVSSVKRSAKEEFVYDFSVERFHNFVASGIIIHNTTLTDNLLAGAGKMSEELAGKQLVTDFDIQEQERGITIYSANVSMVHAYKGRRYLINLIDTPGHVDFGGDVTRAMRAVDGAVVLVDAVDGVMPQTETVLRQALRERVKPVLFINKVDRLIKELKLTPEQMQERFMSIISKVNELIAKNAPPEYKKDWQVNVQEGRVGFGSAYKNWAISIPFMKETGITFKDIIDMTEADRERELAKKAPLHQIVLDMVIKHLPAPHDAQKYRIPKLWKGELDTDEGKAMMDCDPKGHLAGVVTNMTADKHAGMVATVRLFSGTLHDGDSVYVSSKHQPYRVQQVSVYDGPRRIAVGELECGNIIGVAGIGDAGTGDTICEPEHVIAPFESITHVFEPVVTKSIEVVNVKDLPKLIQALKQRAREDATLVVNISEDTGEMLVSGLGELHLEAKVERYLKDRGLEVKVSAPIVIFKEGVKTASGEVEGKSPNKHNKFYFKVEPLTEKVLGTLQSGEVREGKLRKQDEVRTADVMAAAGMSRDEAKKIVFVYKGNLLVNASRGVQYLHEVMELISQGFREVCDKGPMAEGPTVGLKVMITDAKLHEDAIHRGPAQVLPAVRSAVKECMLGAKASIFEPKQIIRIDTPKDKVSSVLSEVQNRRGQMLEMTEEGDVSVMRVKMPVAEMFGFEAALKSATGGRGFQSLIDIVYELLPADLQQKKILEIRKRKGLKEVVPQPGDFVSE